MRCVPHGVVSCPHSECRRRRNLNASVENASTSLTDLSSPLYQAASGSAFYGTTSDTSSCDSSSSSSSSYSDSSSSGSSDCG